MQFAECDHESGSKHDGRNKQKGYNHDHPEAASLGVGPFFGGQDPAERRWQYYSWPTRANPMLQKACSQE
jgi:hypothetical protein